MVVPGGPQQKTAAKKREVTRRATSDIDAKKRPEEPVRPRAARPAAAADGEAKKHFVLAHNADADRDSKKWSVLTQGAAVDRDAKGRLPEELVQPHGAGPAAADREAKTHFVLAQDAPAAAAATTTDRDAKKRSLLPQGAPAKKPPEFAQESGANQQAAKKSPELVQANAAAPHCDISSSPDGGRAKELGAEGAKNCDAPNAAAACSNAGVIATTKLLQATTATTSSNRRGEEEPQDEDLAVDCAADGKEYGKSVEAEEGKNSHEEPEPYFLQKKTSLLNSLFECCGLIDLINDKDPKSFHVSEEIVLICEAQNYYNIKKSVVPILCNFYSSFRKVLGDGECFYRSFIYSYLELVLDIDNTSEENRLMCAIENVSSACRTLQWLYGDFIKHCQAFKELLQRIKKWKTETRAVRRMLLLTYFGDYKETEAIFSFLRISSAAWILSHPEFSEFYPVEDGPTLEQYCRAEILRRRSYADNLAITALSDALGIQIRIFSLDNGDAQDMCVSHSCESTAFPTVHLAYTGIHYDILYPR